MVSFDLCEGNPVALTFMMQAYSVAMFKAETAFQRMQDNGISGSKLYMLWNDCCNRDTAKAVEIMINNDIEDIVTHINYDNGRGIPFEDGKETSDDNH